MNPTYRGQRMLLIVFRLIPRMKSLSRSCAAVNLRPTDQPIGQISPARVFRQIWTYREVRRATFALSERWLIRRGLPDALSQHIQAPRCRWPSAFVSRVDAELWW